MIVFYLHNHYNYIIDKIFIYENVILKVDKYKFLNYNLKTICSNHVENIYETNYFDEFGFDVTDEFVNSFA